MGCRAQDSGLEFGAELLLQRLRFRVCLMYSSSLTVAAEFLAQEKQRGIGTVAFSKQTRALQQQRRRRRRQVGVGLAVRGQRGFKGGQPQLVVQEPAESWRRGCEGAIRGCVDFFGLTRY